MKKTCCNLLCTATLLVLPAVSFAVGGEGASQGQGAKGSIVGKIFADCDSNRLQGDKELGIPGVRVHLDDGSFAVTDNDGKFSFSSVSPRLVAVRLDTASLPQGSELVSHPSRYAIDASTRYIELRPGEQRRVDFSENICSPEVLTVVRLRQHSGEAAAPAASRGGEAELAKNSRLVFDAQPPQRSEGASRAPVIDVVSSTMLRLEGRDVTGSSKETLLPFTSFLGLDVDKLADGNLSVHFYGWGRVEMADRSYNDKSFDGGFTYGYLRYRFNKANADIRAGRFFVHEGIVNEQLDGVSARTDLPMGFGISAFGGATVHTKYLSGEKSDGKGDTLFGGRANYRYKGMLELGVSGIYEGEAPELTSHTNGNYRLVGGDLWFAPHRIIEVMGHTSYSPETKDVAEHSYLLNIKPNQRLVVTGEYGDHHGLSYFNASALFSSMPEIFNLADKSRTAGVSTSFDINTNLQIAADYKHYSREIGNADRFGVDVRVKYLDNTLRGGVGYHYLSAGEGFALTSTFNKSASYHELRFYALHDSKKYFASFDILGDIFKEKIFKEGSAWEATATVGYHLTPALDLSGDLSFGRNPQFTWETKGLIRLVYSMAYAGLGGKK